MFLKLCVLHNAENTSKGGGTCCRNARSVSIYIYISIYTYRSSSRNPRFSVYFRFPGFPLFRTSILSSDLDSTGNFTRDIVSWKFFSIFILILIKSGNNLWKRYKTFYRKIVYAFFSFFNSTLYWMQNFLKKFSRHYIPCKISRRIQTWSQNRGTK